MYRFSSKSHVLGTATLLAAVATVGTVSIFGTPAQSQGKTHEVTVTVERVSAVDKIDALSRPDFMARVTIAGETQTTPFVKDQVDIAPNWKITKAVPGGKTDVKVEILDKDVSLNDPVDINRVANKRDLDFTVDTRNCRIDGFANGYRCDSKIKRAGDQRKSAEIIFSVSVKK